MNSVMGGEVMRFKIDTVIDCVHWCVRVTILFKYACWQYSVNFACTVVDSGLNSWFERLKSILCFHRHLYVVPLGLAGLEGKVKKMTESILLLPGGNWDRILDITWSQKTHAIQAVEMFIKIFKD